MPMSWLSSICPCGPILVKSECFVHGVTRGRGQHRTPRQEVAEGAMTIAEIKAYYERCAGDYDAVYDRPARPDELATLTSRLQELLAGRKVLEVAAGTGYWTQQIAPVTKSVCATDVNEKPLGIARQRDYGGSQIEFCLADAFALETVKGDFDALLAAFWWSHLPVADTQRFLTGVSRRLGGGALVIAIDHRHVESSSHPITHIDADGNTYQHRSLHDGSDWKVLKNFPDPADLQQAVLSHAKKVEIDLLPSHWLLQLTLR
jgi:ubiquinone/menaquinone biosynthesis C-methylase UbiE